MMKVLLVNGSPHSAGTTFTALKETADTLEKEGIETEIFHIGTKPVAGCIACRRCAETGRCVFDDVVNVFLEKAEKADGFIFGSPVYYASVNGSLLSFMDRAFYAGDSSLFYLKPAAAIAVARRAGTLTAFDEMNKFFTIAQMPVISSQYWNNAFGHNGEQARQDEEGMQTMRTLARNMAYFLKCRQAADQAGVPLPAREKHVGTNFIR